MAGSICRLLDELVITERTKLVSFVHESNVLGTINPPGRHRRGRARSVR